MFGPDVIARTLSVSRTFGSSSTQYQYHSRSDHHSKLACWSTAFDLMCTSALLRDHVRTGKVTIGVNHTMLDFRQRRKKDLDLVIARPAVQSETRSMTLRDIATKISVELDAEEQNAFDALPEVEKKPVGSVMIALEAKACMTAHIKSLPRLYDELNSSQQTIHGANDAAIACGLAMINSSEDFISPGLQRDGLPTIVTAHRQESATLRTIEKLRQLPRRTQPGEDGFDAFGILVLELHNDGSPVQIVRGPPAPALGVGETYDEMVTRVSSLYDYRFSTL